MIKKLIRSNNKSNIELFVLALPALLVIFILSYLPMIGLIISFKDTSSGTDIFKMKWAGLSNFKYLFTTADAFIITRNTVLYNFAFILLGTIIAIILSLLLFSMNNKSVKIYQTLLFIPFFISWVVGGYIFSGILDMDYGLLNQILKGFGVQPVAWYLETKYWPFILTFAAIWKSVGYNTLIYYAALLGIDSELYEAAALDGAGKLQQARMISIPMLKPLVTLIVILGIGSIFRGDFGLFYNIPKDSAILYPVTDVIDTYVFRALKKLGDLGMSSAAGFYQSVAGFILVMATNAIVKKVDNEKAIF